MSLFARVADNGGLDDPAWRRFVRRWALVSLALILVASYCSYGFYQFDEYYQVTELVSFKLGKTPEAELAWEYHQRIRPWLQPAAYYAIAQGLRAAGVENPFTWSLAFRAASGLIAWSAVVALMLAAHALFPEIRRRRVAVVLLALLWIIPYQAVRTSSESLSGDFLALGVAALILTSEATDRGRRFSTIGLLVAGLAFGLAFEFRYQIALAVIGAVAWVWLEAPRRRATWRRWLEFRPFAHIAAVLLGVAGPLALGAVVDRWGYGDWTPTAWNYFRVNILEHRASEFGVDPWYGYFYLLNTHILAPLSLLWTAAALVSWWRWPRSLVSMTTLPFVVVHSLIAHKESRFLFPLALVAVLQIVMAFVPAEGQERRPGWLDWFWSARKSWPARAIYAMNLIALVVGCVTVRRPGLELQKYIYEHAGADCHVYLLGEKDPYQNVGVMMYFYRPAGFTYTRLGSYDDLKHVAEKGPSQFWLITDQISLPPRQSAVLPDAELAYRSYPAWLERFNYFHWLDRSRTFSMYRVERRSEASTAAFQNAPRSGIRDL